MFGSGNGPLSDLLSGHFGGGANYTDDHVEVPVEHGHQLCEAYSFRGDLLIAESKRANERAWIRGEPVEVER